MDKKTLCRVELTPDAFVVIEAEAYLSGRSLKSIASEILSEHCSLRAKDIANMKSSHVINLKSLTAKDTDDHMIIESKVQMTQESTDQTSSKTTVASMVYGMPDDGHSPAKEQQQEPPKDLTVAQEPQGTMAQEPAILKTKGIQKDEDAKAKFKTLWNGGLHNRSEIGRRIGYNGSQISALIKKMKKNGEWVE
jgi:hypothetical protein